MNIKLLRAAAAILALIMMLSACSCALQFNSPEKKESSETDTQQIENEESTPDYAIVENDFYQTVKKHLNSVGNADYEGASVMIASFAPELTDPDKCGTVMSQAVYDRNSMVEDRFHVEIFTKQADPDTIYTEVYNANLSGEFYADVLTIPQYYIGQFAAGGVLMNMQSLPFADYGAGYNIKSGVEAAIAGSDGYALAGWASLQPDKLACVYFNRDLFDKAGLEYPYELVKSGKWTWDRFFELSQKASELGAASYGYRNTEPNIGDAVYVSCGNTFISGGAGKAALISVNAEAAAPFVDIAYRLFNDGQKDKNSIEAVSAFADGKSLFLIDVLGTSKAIAASSAKWGVLPMPKASEEQEKYVSLAASDTAFFAVPAGSTAPDKASHIISALNAASLGYIAQAYVDDYMYYYLRDNASVSMVEKICYGAYYDMAYSVGTNDLSIANSTYFAIRNIFENNHDVNFYLNSFEYRANSALANLFPY